MLIHLTVTMARLKSDSSEMNRNANGRERRSRKTPKRGACSALRQALKPSSIALPSGGLSSEWQAVKGQIIRVAYQLTLRKESLEGLPRRLGAKKARGERPCNAYGSEQLHTMVTVWGALLWGGRTSLHKQNCASKTGTARGGA